mgnify:CR=1 FL=1
MLRVASPLPGRATVMRDGVQVEQAEGRTFEFVAREPGKYRVEFDGGTGHVITIDGRDIEQ